MPSKHEITMITTNLTKANIELNKMKLLGGGGCRGGGGGRGGGTGRGDGSCGAERAGGGGNNAATSHAWMLTKTTITIKHPTKGYDMKWYKLCGPGNNKGTPTGMNMQAPHNHVKWLLTKKEKQEKINAKKKTLKANKSKAGDDTNSTSNNAKHLNPSDTIVNGLTTEIMLGDSKAYIIAKRWFQNANAGISDLADKSVKD
jgi:hypothetical protein